MNKFLTLLKREWLQHRWGWMSLALAPTALITLVVLFTWLAPGVEGSVDMEAGEVAVFIVPLMLMLMTFVLAVAAALFQAPGLARRDAQDRSIEFWLSQPVGHVPSVGATLLAHYILWPLAATVVGFAGGLALLPLITWLEGAEMMLQGATWASALGAAFAVLARLLLGILLALVWLSPVLLAVMAASAWLKRWGLPALVGVSGLLVFVESRYFGSRHLLRVLQEPFLRAGEALVTTPTGLLVESGMNVEGNMPNLLLRLPGLLNADAGAALTGLATPVLLPVLAVAGLCFYALVLRRQRGG